MPIQHRSQITTAISRLNQTDYVTRAASGADYRRMLNDSQEVMEWAVTSENDAGYDQGSDLPNDVWLALWSSGVPLQGDVCFQDIGYVLKDALGGYAVETIATGRYKHTFTPLDVTSTRQLPSRTIMKPLGSLGLYVGRSFVCSQFRLSGGKTGRLKYSAQYVGSGHVEINPAGYAMPGSVDDREYAYANQVVGGLEIASGGTAQVTTATAAGTATTPGTVTLVVTSANLTGSPISVAVELAGTENAAAQAALYRAALSANTVINKRFIVSGTSASVVLTDRIRAADDATLNVAIVDTDTTGITAAPTSAATTAGVAATTSKSYSCDLETWSLSLANPAAEEGYRQCSENLDPLNPESGVLRSEYLLGQRAYTLDFSTRLNSSDPLRTLLNAQTNVRVRIPIFGIDTSDSSLVILHDRARIMSVQEVPDVGGFIGVNGQIQLLGTSGVIGLTAELVNDVVSYAS